MTDPAGLATVYQLDDGNRLTGVTVGGQSVVTCTLRRRARTGYNDP